jgi:hypothetical protein
MRVLLKNEQCFVGGGSEGGVETPAPCTDGFNPNESSIPYPQQWEIWWLRNQPRPTLTETLPSVPEDGSGPYLPPPALGDVMKYNG